MAEACQLPADVLIPITHGSIPLLGEHLRSIQIQVSDASVRRTLQDAELQPHRQKMWITSQEDAFRDKRDEARCVYFDSSQTEHILCLDEKTGTQALERR